VRARGLGQDDLRRHNLSAVLHRVHDRGQVSRAELTESTGLNRSTVGDLVSGLAAAGLVVEDRPEPAARARAGRPSLVVRPRPGAVSAVAAYVDVHALHVVRVGLGGQVLDRRREPHAPRPDSAGVARRIAALTAELAPAGWPERAGLVGVGVAVPGTVRSEDGSVAVAPHLGWEDVPLATLVGAAVAAELGTQVRVDVANDADLGVHAERLRGAAQGCTDVIYLCGTLGLGGGIVCGGRPLVGSRGFAGEVAHVSVDPAGRACRCGSRGCWESEALADAWALPFDLDAHDPRVAALVAGRLAVGDVVARRTRDRISRSYARGLASIANVFDPQVVVLGAGLWRDLWPEVSGDVLPWLQRLVIPVLRERLPVRLAGLGPDSTVLGAAELAFAPLLADPLGALGDRATA